MDTEISIVVIEDNEAYSKTLLDTIELSEGMVCIGNYNTAESCLRELEKDKGQKPSILLLDLNLPGQNGLTMLPQLLMASPDTEVIILTQNDDYHLVLEAIRLGASGYLLKGGTIAGIRNTIREVAAGASVIDAQLSRIVLNSLSSGEKSEDNPLSPREMEVLALLAQGYAKKEVADSLGLSYHAVALYVRNIFKKLGTPNIAAAIATAIRRNFI
ncbi:response regulator transcription factor [Pelagicoccus sp. NFK12]|uniref:Response regulator transcription factor n=1 Tax=Pelagicoccus enzymogenes TaxID=2773457 RepID=A0A927FC26_9BACT|nr:MULTISPECIES: response regulator transcription factor [Pelagicoccus]MBD5781639.1 response regulator transcription factor [Pelagicoccus enzymogenes]MDQ8181160.1 response regulator transcription factor [Pelagicoccus sp. SDUM812005]